MDEVGAFEGATGLDSRPAGVPGAGVGGRVGCLCRGCGGELVSWVLPARPGGLRRVLVVCNEDPGHQFGVHGERELWLRYAAGRDLVREGGKLSRESIAIGALRAGGVRVRAREASGVGAGRPGPG